MKGWVNLGATQWFWFKVVNLHSASRNPHNLADSFETDLMWKLKYITLEIFWPKNSETNSIYSIF